MHGKHGLGDGGRGDLCSPARGPKCWLSDSPRHRDLGTAQVLVIPKENRLPNGITESGVGQTSL